jgi:acyl carrier protein
MQGIVQIVRPVTVDEVRYDNGILTEIKDTGLDSLDMIMISVYLSELYGVPEEVAKTMTDVVTLADVFTFMNDNKTKTPPETVEACLELIK